MIRIVDPATLPRRWRTALVGMQRPTPISPTSGRLKEAYETRIEALERRFKEAEMSAAKVSPTPRKHVRERV